MSQWVQHKSGQGEKWEVLGQSRSRWEVKCELDMGLVYCLPKSEYVLVEPPETWVDITHQCGFQSEPPNHKSALYFQHYPDSLKCNTLFEWPYLATIEGYRLIKKHLTGQWAFLVEKKVQP